MAILTVICSSAMAADKPLKVYILAGQSNMEGQAKVETFDYIGDDSATAPLLEEMRAEDGMPRVCDRVWISYLTGSPDRGTLGEGIGKTADYFENKWKEQNLKEIKNVSFNVVTWELKNGFARLNVAVQNSNDDSINLNDYISKQMLLVEDEQGYCFPSSPSTMAT